ncbi:MAG: site-specific DNA-methyltransferase [Halodesulfurarchaeum sp.]
MDIPTHAHGDGAGRGHGSAELTMNEDDIRAFLAVTAPHLHVPDGDRFTMHEASYVREEVVRDDVMRTVMERLHDLSHGSVIHGDALTILDELPSDHFHAIVTDPPYGLSFMDEEWDQFDGNDAAYPNEDAAHNYAYRKWTRTWAEKAIRVLKPGGHIIAFGGNRTHHRLMDGLEDAGFTIRDTTTWHYAQGLPKGSSLSTWIDGEKAELWGDWRGTLKPATEFAVLARAPLGADTATANQVTYGVGNLNVEAARIGSGRGGSREGEATAEKRYTDEGSSDFAAQPGPRGGHEDGRYPANLVLDEVMAEVMDMQSGELESGDVRRAHDGTEGHVYGDGLTSVAPEDVYADSGGASRFFYTSKASPDERRHGGKVDNDHPTVKPRDLMRWLIKIVTAEGQRVLDPFAGSGTTILAADDVDREAVGIEMNEEYVTIARERIADV